MPKVAALDTARPKSLAVSSQSLPPAAAGAASPSLTQSSAAISASSRRRVRHPARAVPHHLRAGFTVGLDLADLLALDPLQLDVDQTLAAGVAAGVVVLGDEVGFLPRLCAEASIFRIDELLPLRGLVGQRLGVVAQLRQHRLGVVEPLGHAIGSARSRTHEGEDEVV